MTMEMFLAMANMWKACRHQHDSPGSCRECPFYNADAEPAYDESGEELTGTMFCSAGYPSIWDAFHPELRDGKKAFRAEELYAELLPMVEAVQGLDLRLSRMPDDSLLLDQRKGWLEEIKDTAIRYSTSNVEKNKNPSNRAGS